MNDSAGASVMQLTPSKKGPPSEHFENSGKKPKKDDDGQACGGLGITGTGSSSSTVTSVAQLHQLTCQKCEDVTTIVPQVSNVVHEENCTRKFVERRISKGNKILKAWWDDVHRKENRAKLKAFMGKRKKNPFQTNATDEEIMGTLEEVKGVGTENRDRSEYYDYHGFVEDMELRHPDWDEDDMVAEWEKRCADERYAAIDDDNDIMIRSSIGKRLVCDLVQSSMTLERLAKRRKLESSDDVAQFNSNASKMLAAFKKSIVALAPKAPRMDVPGEVRSAVVNGDVSAQVEAMLARTNMLGVVQQELHAKQQADEENEADELTAFKNKQKEDQEKKN